MICQFLQESLFASNQYDAFILFIRETLKLLSECIRTRKFSGNKFPGETFRTQNMLVRNGQSQFVSNSYSLCANAISEANQVEKHCYSRKCGD